MIVDLIASSGLPSPRIRTILSDIDLVGTPVEGFPIGKGTFYANRIEVDPKIARAERLTREAFGAGYANVQSLSASVANVIVMHALWQRIAKPQNRKLKVLSADTANGGHFTHGRSGHITELLAQTFSIPQDGGGKLCVKELEACFSECKPDVLILGGSSNLWHYEFESIGECCRMNGAVLWFDASHHAGFMLAGHYPSALPHADLMTFSMQKTFAGPRCGVILARDEQPWGPWLDSATYPGIQGEPNLATIVAIGETFEEWENYRFVYAKAYAFAQIMAARLTVRGLKLVGGGTETQMVILDLKPLGLRGRVAADFLARAGILSNQMPLPGDQEEGILDVEAMSGIRFGTFAMARQGILNERQVEQITDVIADGLLSLASILAYTEGTAWNCNRLQDALLDRMRRAVDAIPELVG